MAATARSWNHHLDGRRGAPASAEAFPVLDPSTEEVIAFDEGPWRTTTAPERGRILFRLAERARAR